MNRRFAALFVVTTLVALNERPFAGAAQGGGVAASALCTTLTSGALTKITSVTYASTNSQIDTANLKHCEYRGGPQVVSLMLATLPNARSRFDTAAMFPGIQSIASLGDRANWEPVRGMLSVLAGERSVEVSVNAPHGAPAARQQMAIQIAKILLGL